MIYASDPGWGAAAVAGHRKLIEALRRHDTAAVVELTQWQFTDAARRLDQRLDHRGLRALAAAASNSSARRFRLSAR